jgi:membrane protein required for colicin V production
MTVLDFLVMFCVLGFGVLGLLHGFVRECLSFFSWGAGFLVARLLQPLLAPLVESLVRFSFGVPLLSFALGFALGYFGLRIFAVQLNAAMEKMGLGGANTTLGLVFGGAKGVLLASVAFWIMALLVDFWDGPHVKRPQWMRDSITYPLLKSSSNLLVGIVQSRQNRASIDDASESAENLVVSHAEKRL